ncbi:MAG: twitching motility protein PilT [Methanobacteriales archaeon HGW-Methanobacteriales-1]|jgi:predicted nucleic acid-binding protein|nr:MAG: twitching motility protein PilT [Methanobacteriales archaeon HGW-Methanobacteriales-1]
MNKFVDTNVFIHAMLPMKDGMNEKEKRIKQNSMEILTRIQNGEVVFITTLQIAEIMNLLERWQGHEIARDILKFLVESFNVKIFEITNRELIDALDLFEKYKHNKIGINDLITYVSMKRNDIQYIYSFDSHFDQFPDINRLDE